MIDRVHGPNITNDFDLTIRHLESGVLPNGIQTYEVNNGTQDIIKVELVIKSGRVNETKVGAAKAAISLLREGSTSKSSKELAYLFDYYGSSVKLSAGVEFSSITLVCLTRYFDKVWPEWLNMVINPEYSDEELEKYKNVAIQNLKNQLSKNDIVSYRVITEKIFGSSHPYGYNTNPEHIKALNKSDLHNFYVQNCGMDNSFVVLSGSYSKSIRSTIFNDLGHINHSTTPYINLFSEPEKATGVFHEKTKNESQVSIKLGCLWVDRHHADYNSLKFLSTVLGGYFGSRLMKNIREEKGYTYGIYSSFDGWDKGGSFYISTDVSNDLVNDTIAEIYKEIEVLKHEKVAEDELDMVKNYILGQSLHLIDGPFATAQLVKNIYAKNRSIELFAKNVAEIKMFDGEKVLEMANKYFNKDQFVTVLAGNI